MNKKTKIILICISAAIFGYFFIRNVITSFSFFTNPEGFSLLPPIYATMFLVIMACHFGLYVLVMDEQKKVRQIEDDPEWWRRWDRT